MSDLSSLPVGETAVVSRIHTDGLLRRRLLDLGFVPSTRVESVRRSPGGDPTIYRVRGAKVALRKSDAKLIEVQTGGPSQSSPAKTSCSHSKVCRQCHISAAHNVVFEPNRSDSRIVALAGNPNTGKSTLFNALTGLHQHVGNWPGKTVARMEGSWNYNGASFNLVDLPGTYSLLSTSADEEIARDFLLFGAPDCTIVVVDATCLERNLNLVFQIFEITNRVVVCVNLLDEARRRKIFLDLEALEEDLGTPVVGIVARTGEGLEHLKEKVLAVADGRIVPSPLQVPYQPELQAAIDDLIPLVNRAFPGIPQARWIALRLIEGGDTRLREEIESGVLGNLTGQIGETSLGGVLSPQYG
ncbi:MAG: 50S ribosome-binding GTPase [Candidatus Omnitrophica bacterium]|nr:50S ribosome-binding GTPase [Candidatus Omnitrophota bacterium]